MPNCILDLRNVGPRSLSSIIGKRYLVSTRGDLPSRSIDSIRIYAPARCKKSPFKGATLARATLTPASTGQNHCAAATRRALWPCGDNARQGLSECFVMVAISGVPHPVVRYNLVRES